MLRRTAIAIALLSTLTGCQTTEWAENGQKTKEVLPLGWDFAISGSITPQSGGRSCEYYEKQPVPEIESRDPVVPLHVSIDRDMPACSMLAFSLPIHQGDQLSVAAPEAESVEILTNDGRLIASGRESARYGTFNQFHRTVWAIARFGDAASSQVVLERRQP